MSGPPGRTPTRTRLTLCEVDPGDGPPVEVVCGAPNVAAGQKICFARPGVALLNMHTGRREELKPARIRGIVSEGMICSEAELEISDEHEGIIVLPDETTVGASLDDVLGDTFLELELTPNRGDCLSMLGVAREIGAITGQPVRVPDTSYVESNTPVSDFAKVTIADPDLCLRYTASVDQGNHHRPVAELVAGSPDAGRTAANQQRGGRHQLRHAGVQPAAARFRPGHGDGSSCGGAPRDGRRKIHHPGWG